MRGVTFHNLRGTAVVALALAGCTVPEIASITGHSLADAEALLTKHYLGRDGGDGQVRGAENRSIVRLNLPNLP